MAKKEFRYRGYTLDELKELSRDEIIKLLPSTVRRSLKRGYTEESKKAEQNLLSGDDVRTHCREVVILPGMVGKIARVHNGQDFKEVRIEAEMIGHRLGEFAHTRSNVQHSAPGVGATRSSAALSVR